MFLLEIDPLYLLIFGMCGMVILFVAFFFAFSSNQKKKMQHQKDLQSLREHQQNQLIEAAVRSEEIERHRIAETLHDEVGAILSSTKLHLEGIKHNDLTERDKQLYTKTKDLLDDATQKVRSISHNLHSNILKEFGLNEAIRHFVKNVVKSGLMNADTHLDDQYETKNPENDISIYRMVQELINNILKHAHATQLHIASTFSNQHLNLTINYDGKGLSQQQFEEFRYSKDGLGLKNIQNRVILLKGTIAFSAKPDGNSISISIPQQQTVL
jgi:two-component system NarL family sensor kinase